jgi:hypothetical protein
MHTHLILESVLKNGSAKRFAGTINYRFIEQANRPTELVVEYVEDNDGWGATYITWPWVLSFTTIEQATAQSNYKKEPTMRLTVELSSDCQTTRDFFGVADYGVVEQPLRLCIVQVEGNKRIMTFINWEYVVGYSALETVATATEDTED